MATKNKPQLTRVAWQFHRDGSATVRLSPDAVLILGDILNEWKSWASWAGRDDCQNWKRSPIARENRREGITFANCLSSIKCLLGRRDVLRVMAQAKTKRK